MATTLVGLAMVLAASLSVRPAEADMSRPLEARLDPAAVAALFPDADRQEKFSDDPPVFSVLQGDRLQGYLFSTLETIRPGGYSGEPFDIIVGMNTDARIIGAVLLEHREPIVGPNKVPETRLIAYFDRLAGADITRPIKRGNRGVDGVAGATISATLMHGAIVQSARRVARLTGLLGEAGPGGLALDRNLYEETDWQGLLDLGSVTSLTVTRGAVAAALGGTATEAEAPFVRLHVALATPAGIGRPLFDDKWYNHHLSVIGFGEQLLVVANEGPFAYKRAFQDPAFGSAGPFGALRLIQGDRVIPLEERHALRHTAIRAEGAPSFREISLFRLFQDDGFDPLAPWRLELAIRPVDAPALAGTGAADAAPARFAVDYRLPAKFVSGSDYDLEEAGFIEPAYAMFGLWRESTMVPWQQAWVAQQDALAGLIGLLLVVSLVFVFQDRITRWRAGHRWLRIGILAIVLVWLGWALGAQLTIINLLTYMRAALGAVDPVVLLMEPLIIVIAAYTLLSLVLLGRGVFCGWLCPFGALQELANRLARWARVPQLNLPFTLNERLWTVKYIVLMVLVATAFWSMDTAATLAEVEPFKTAISLKFARSWPYVAYAVVLLVIGLFMERFFCRFLCPLGAGLVLLGRVRVFQWLKRRPACGTACHICEQSCPVQAIPPSGLINMNECFQCLDCQVDYFDETVCPPLVRRRKQRERLAIA